MKQQHSKEQKRKKNSKHHVENATLFSRKMKWILFGASCLLIILFSCIIAYMLFFRVTPVHVVLMPYDFYVNDTVGFDVGNDMMHFGQFLRTGGAQRSFSIQNEFTSIVKLTAQGEYAEYISFSDNDFLLLEGQLKSVNASIRIPPNLEFGKYTGDIIVSFYKID